MSNLPADVPLERLLALVGEPEATRVLRALDAAACATLSPDIYHPESGRPPARALALCVTCPARLPCLALALRTEQKDQRHGWYGGLGPAERGEIAVRLGLGDARTVVADRASESVRLRAAGWPVGAIASHLRCSRRTVQRYLRPPTAATTRPPQRRRATTRTVAVADRRSRRSRVDPRPSYQ
jgi:hypothetical protein